MVSVYGYSDDLVEIEGSSYEEDEVSCIGQKVRIWFDDGTVILIGYPKREDLGVWKIDVEQHGTSQHSLHVCENENDDPYSDVFTIDADVEELELVDESDGGIGYAET